MRFAPLLENLTTSLEGYIDFWKNDERDRIELTVPGADELAPDFVGLESMLELFHKATGEGFFGGLSLSLVIISLQLCLCYRWRL